MGYKVKSEKERAEDAFRTFEDLEVYQVSREFRKAMYRVQRTFPEFEKYELGSQMRRAAVSLTNNIAEGHGRFYFADQVKFFLASRGSLQELIDDLNTCEDERYLNETEVAELKAEGWRVLGLLNGYLRYLRDRKLQQQSRVGEVESGGSSEDVDALRLLEETLCSPPF